MINKMMLISLIIALGSSRSIAQGNSKATEVWEPVPKVIVPVIDNQPPSDAIILFDKNNLSQWIGAKDGLEPEWLVGMDGVVTVKPGAGDIKTKQNFGSCQLHVEWCIPVNLQTNGQNRGNSGIFLMGLYELQVLDSYDNKTYSNGQAGSIYKQHIPLVNACLKAGTWQVYDIIFTAPKFNEDGSLLSPARFTVLHNGVLVQNNVEVKGPTVFIGKPSYKAHPGKLPLALQEHDNSTSFRNIWVREL